MDAARTERVTANLSPELVSRLDRFAEQHRWTRSTAIAVLVERGLESEE